MNKNKNKIKIEKGQEQEQEQEREREQDGDKPRTSKHKQVLEQRLGPLTENYRTVSGFSFPVSINSTVSGFSFIYLHALIVYLHSC